MGRVLRLRVALAVLAVLSLATVGSSGASGAGSTASNIYTIAGIGSFGDTGDGGQATEAEINQPRSLFVIAGGGYVFAEPWSNKVRLVQPDGTITSIAGTGTAGFSGDGGPATSANLSFVHSAVPMPGGGYAIADTLNNRIRRVWPDGTITTVAGTGTAGFSGDGGPAASAGINNPRGVAVFPDGTLIFPDSNNHRIRKISPTGTITTAAGTGVQGFSGDGGPATSANLSIPFCVAPTGDGGFLICDIGNQRIRKVSANGTITTVAGNGVRGFTGDLGPATAAEISDSHNVAALGDGGFLIADSSNERVRRVLTDGTITTIAGGRDESIRRRRWTGDECSDRHAEGSGRRRLGQHPGRRRTEHADPFRRNAGGPR